MFLEKLCKKHPDLYSIIEQRAKNIISSKAQEPVVERLNLTSARKFLTTMSKKKISRLAIVGSPTIIEVMFRAELFSSFDVPFIVATNGDGVPSIFGKTWEMIPVRSPENFSKFPETEIDAALVLDTKAVPPTWSKEKLAYLNIIPPCGLPFSVPDSLKENYEQFTQAFIQDLQVRLHRLGRSENIILFTGIYTYFNFNRLSIVLRKHGYKTIFMSLNPSNQFHKKKHFDLIIHANGDLNLFYMVINAFPFLAVHYQGWLNLHAFAAVASLSTTSKFIIEFNDMAHMLFSPEEHDCIFGNGIATEENRATTFLFEHSDHVVFNYAQGSGEKLLCNCTITPPYEHFHSYPLPEFFKSEPPESSAPYRIAFAGTLSPSYFPDPPFGDVKLMDLAHTLTDQGMEFHIFLNPYQANQAQGIFWDYQYFAARTPGFKIYSGCGPEELSQKLASMHFGSMLYQFPPNFSINPEHLTYIMPTKFFSYVEAGLPVLVSDRFTALAALVKEHGIGLVISQNEIPVLSTKLTQTDHKALRNNVIVFRKEFNLHRLIQKLEKVYGFMKLDSIK
ncbi:hypothetical protein [uncultured Desulfobacter sp.]|uniref:hypothetical protein n=1 Tax=uncultured Desulfobacter sp. TaxID=240139 RepID=UPI0029F597DB|nr:hypothetical protein [uncultured Desulfobacter sp.]